MDIFSLTDKLTPTLNGMLPGKRAQQRMITQPRTTFDPPYSEDQAIPSAVLILLHPAKQDIRFFLTQRTHDVAHHKGQISLPGGVQEKNESLSDTALRETHEEIGIDEDGISILGKLTPLFIPFTGFMVHPFIGWMPDSPSPKPDTNEVYHLFSVSIIELLNENFVHEETVNFQGQNILLPYYLFDKKKVWGATAMILSEFKTILRKTL